MTPPPKHAPRIPFALLVTGLVVGGLALLLALNTASAANELDRHDLAAKDAAISAQLEQLRNEVAASAAPGALASAAAQLGMVPAGNPAFIEIGPDGKVVVLGHPAAVTGVPLQRTHTTPKPPQHHTTTTATSTKTATAPATKTTTKTTSTTPANPATKTTTKTTTTTKTATPTPTPTLTPTPTPTTTLGGGPR